MARRKNTAECREVLRKVFENESAGAGGNSDGRGPGPGGRSLAGRTGGSRIAGSGASEVDPLLGKPQGADSESFDRHDSIRSSAPGVGLGDRQAGFSGSIERPAGDKFTSNVSDARGGGERPGRRSRAGIRSRQRGWGTPGLCR